MATQRVIPLLLLLGLGIFILQNSTPSLSLVLWGQTTLALPLSLWILGAIAAGAITMAILMGLLGLANRPRKSRFRPSTPLEPEAEGTWGGVQSQEFISEPLDDWETGGMTWGQNSPQPTWPQPTATATPDEVPANGTNVEVATSAFDLPSEPSEDDFDLDDLDWETDTETNTPVPEPAQRPIYEVQRSPTRQRREGTLYTYSYRDREPADTGVGETPSSLKPESKETSNPDTPRSQTSQPDTDHDA